LIILHSFESLLIGPTEVNLVFFISKLGHAFERLCRLLSFYLCLLLSNILGLKFSLL